jgi:hypothetical protein
VRFESRAVPLANRPLREAVADRHRVERNAILEITQRNLGVLDHGVFDRGECHVVNSARCECACAKRIWSRRATHHAALSSSDAPAAAGDAHQEHVTHTQFRTPRPNETAAVQPCLTASARQVGVLHDCIAFLQSQEWHCFIVDPLSSSRLRNLIPNESSPRMAPH